MEARHLLVTSNPDRCQNPMSSPRSSSLSSEFSESQSFSIGTTLWINSFQAYIQTWIYGSLLWCLAFRTPLNLMVTQVIAFVATYSSSTCWNALACLEYIICRDHLLEVNRKSEDVYCEWQTSSECYLSHHRFIINSTKYLNREVIILMRNTISQPFPRKKKRNFDGSHPRNR